MHDKYDVSVGPLLKQPPSMSDVVKQEFASMVYNAPSYLAEQFNRVSALAKRTLRSSNLDLRPPRLKPRHGQNCYVYKGTSALNSLPGSFKRNVQYMLVGKN